MALQIPAIGFIVSFAMGLSFYWYPISKQYNNSRCYLWYWASIHSTQKLWEYRSKIKEQRGEELLKQREVIIPSLQKQLEYEDLCTQVLEKRVKDQAAPSVAEQLEQDGVMPNHSYQPLFQPPAANDSEAPILDNLEPDPVQILAL
ncbi:MAG: hypothetical protein ABI597_08230 [Gammaproteobacteria bacterium]